MKSTPAEAGMVKGVVNGPVLDFLHGLMTVKNLDPSTHRITQAAWLMGGMFVGRWGMNILVGENPAGDKVESPKILKDMGIAGSMAYNKHADDDWNRTLKIVDTFVPAAFGLLGGMAGSYHFAMGMKPYELAKAGEKAMANMTMEQAVSRAKLSISEPWRWTAAVSSSGGSSLGHALVPGNFSYGGALGSSFLFYTNRDKTMALPVAGLREVSQFMTGNKHYYPNSPAVLPGMLRDYLVHNPSKRPPDAEKMAYALLEQLFGDQVKPKHVSAFLDEAYKALAPLSGEKGVPAAKKAEAVKALDGIITGHGFEKTVAKIGLNPMDAAVTRYGYLEQFARTMGKDADLNKIQEEYRKGVAKRLGMPYAPASTASLREKTHPGDSSLLSVGNALYATALGGTALFVNSALGKQKQERETVRHVETPSTETPAIAEAASVTPDASVSRATVSPRAQIARKSTPILGTLEWISENLNSQETMGAHRVWCAFMMGVAGLVGMEFSKALHGRTFAGAAVAKDQVPEFLHCIYNKLPYNPHSNAPADRWMYVLHGMVPSVAAAAGIITASEHFFRDRARAVEKSEWTIDNATEKVLNASAGPWTLLTATSGEFLATPSLNIYAPIPGVNYGASLGTRFMAKAGRKVAMPGLGKIWSGNESYYAEAGPKLLDRMIKYSVNNPSEHPEQLEAMAIGILKPWFENVTPEQINQFVAKVEADRNAFLAAGGIPEERKKECVKVLTSHFEGTGLEATLREIGLDPMLANLDSNGLTGSIARMLGAGEKIDSIQETYRQKYTERLKAQAATAAEMPTGMSA